MLPTAMSYPANGPNWIDRNRPRGKPLAATMEERWAKEREAVARVHAAVLQAPSPSPMPQRMLTPSLIPVQPTISSFSVALSEALKFRVRYPVVKASFITAHTLPALSKSKAKKHHNTGVYVPRIANLQTTERPHDNVQVDSLGRIRQVPIAITFAPSHGVCNIGVALEDADQCIGMVDPSASIDEHGAIPPEYRALTRMGKLVIEWPGYPVFSAPIDLLVDDVLGAPYVERKYFAYQIAQIVNKFATSAPTRPYNPTNAELCGFEGPLTLGPKLRRGQASDAQIAVRVNQIRLLEAVSFNGRDFYLRLFVVDG